jgi:hypothetical protein
MASTSGVCLVLKSMAPLKTFNLSSDTIKCALYTSTATNNSLTTAYSATNEASGTGYTPGGNTLSGFTSGTGLNSGSVQTAWWSWSNTSWTTATFSAASLLIYDSTLGTNNAIEVFDFGGTFTVTAGTFTIVFPTADQNNAILRAA